MRRDIFPSYKTCHPAKNTRIVCEGYFIFNIYLRIFTRKNVSNEGTVYTSIKVKNDPH